MKVKMYAQTVAGQANAPGMSSKVIRLIGVPVTHPIGEPKPIPSPNESLLSNKDIGGFTFDASGLVKDVHAEFEEGQVYIVEIRPAGPKD